MSRIFVAGLGAVSPAGWNVAALRAALDQGEPLPVQSLERPGWEKPLRARLVPNPTSRPEFLTHPRLRRASPITHYVVASALEAMAQWRVDRDPKFHLGLVVCLQSGCVNYSCRFYEETLKDPTTASPLLFPETVYAAPASHLAAAAGKHFPGQLPGGRSRHFSPGNILGRPMAGGKARGRVSRHRR